MDVEFEKIVEIVTNFMEHEAKIDTVVGKEFKLGDFMVVPVIRFGMGFGTGGRDGDKGKNGNGTGMGAGGGMGLEPIGFLASKGDHIEFISTRTHRGLDAIFDKVPHLIERFMDSNKKEPEKEE